MLDPFMKDHGARHVGEIRLRNGRIVKTITSSDTAESRNKFDALNVHKTRGVARSLKSLKAAKKSEGGADADIVDQPVSGGPAPRPAARAQAARAQAARAQAARAQVAPGRAGPRR